MKSTNSGLLSLGEILFPPLFSLDRLRQEVAYLHSEQSQSSIIIHSESPLRTPCDYKSNSLPI